MTPTHTHTHTHTHAQGGSNTRPGSMPSNVISNDLMRGAVPHTPLAAVLQQYKEAEVAWAHDKVCVCVCACF